MATQESTIFKPGPHVPVPPGTVYGKLTVIKRVPNLGGHRHLAAYECRCECGRVKIVHFGNLKYGKSTSCHCTRRPMGRPYKGQNKVGKQFGRLVVFSYLGTGRYAGQFKAKWLCRCDCGRFVEKWTGHLRTGSDRSPNCGQHRYIDQDQFVHRVLTSYRHQCGVIGRKKLQNYRRRSEFTLTIEEAKRIIFSNCFYCGTQPENRVIFKKSEFWWIGIDRQDNNKGYTADNCVPCCKTCNYAKNKMSLNDFSQWVRRLFQYQTTTGTLLRVDP